MPLREKIAWVVLVVVAVLYFRGGPGPTPPGPQPDPTPPAPIPVQGLHVLIVEETAERPRLTKEQLAILTASDVRAWLDANAKYRILDKDAPMDHDESVWRDAMRLPRQRVPWMICSNGQTGYSGPLPADSKAFLELVGKYK